MAESAVFKCMAHVFTIDPRTKKSWLPASKTAIPVSFLFDKSLEQYRIVSIDDSVSDQSKRMTVNSLMAERISFKKTSQKFGQWADPSSGAVYGLGFSNEAELDRFVQQFCLALEHTRRLRKQPSVQSDHHQPQVDLDPDSAEQQLQTEREKLAAQLQLVARNVQRLEQENHMLRSARNVESNSRAAQLERDNAAMKARINQLEETMEQQQQQLIELPSVSSNLQRSLQQAADMCSQLVTLQPQQQQQPQQQS